MNQSHTTSGYYQPRLIVQELYGRKVSYYSKPGIAAWDEIPPSISLLAENIIQGQERIWCINCGPGHLAVFISSMCSNSSCWISNPDHLAQQCTNLTRQENHLANLSIVNAIDMPAELVSKTDLVLLSITKSRHLNRRWLVQAWSALKPQGILLLSGPNDFGIQSVAKDASQLFQSSCILGYKKGNRIIQLVKSQPEAVLPEWALMPGIAPGTWHSLHIAHPSASWDLSSLPGVFSYDKLDKGTDLMLSALGEMSGRNILDIGCGYGIIGLTAARQGAGEVDLVDTNLLAIASTQENIRRLNYSNCKAILSDLFSELPGKAYHYILSNPPFHLGNQVEYSIAHTLISGAYTALVPGGKLQLVANRFIRYDRMMAQVFGNVTTLAETPAYHVLCSTKL